MMIAAKFHDDVTVNNEAYARIGAVKLPDINILEIELLQSLEFRLVVEADTYVELLLHLEDYDPA